jgi:hypothetical protein
MSRFAQPVAARRDDQAAAEFWSCNRRWTGIISLGILLLPGIGCAKAPTPALPASRAPQAATAPPTPNKTLRIALTADTQLVADSRQTLTELHETMATLTNRVLATAAPARPTEAELAGQKAAVESAKAGYQQMLLAREAAELALKEYEEGIYPHERFERENEVDRALADVESAKQALAPTKTRYAKLKQASSGKTADAATILRFQREVSAAELRQKKATFWLEQAQTKRKLLLEFEHERKLLELNARLSKARTDELVRHAALQHQDKKLQRMQEPPEQSGKLSDDRTRILAMFDDAMRIEEKLKARLDQIKDGDDVGPSLRQEITDLTRSLKTIIRRARLEHAAEEPER